MKSATKTILSNIIKSFFLALVVLSINNCGTNSKTIEVKKTTGFQQNHGPFDADGNYVESWADEAPSRKYVWKRPTTNHSAPTQKTTQQVTQKTVSNTTNRSTARTSTPQKTTSSTTSKKTTAKKITPKSKPPISHTVKKGDTLYGLGRKYGTSVTAIQKANNIKGSNIAIGKRLIIPRK